MIDDVMDTPTARDSVDLRRSMDAEFMYVRSQEDLLAATKLNPTPTTVPPPIGALAGNIGERHVLIFLGLPLVGKRTIALRLKRYLRFFHGARCRAFDIAKIGGPVGTMNPDRATSPTPTDRATSPTPPDSNAHSVEFFEKLRSFLESTDENSSPSQRKSSDGENANETESAVEDAARRLSALKPADGGSSPRPPKSRGGGHGHRRSQSVNGIDPADKNAKNVDSGRVAIVFSSDAMRTFYENWSASSKERRRWILARLASLSATSKTKTRVKTIFIEVTLTKESLVNEILAQKLARDVREGRINGGADGAVEAAAAAWREKVLEFKKLYVTLQNDGSEDDLSYIKLINYGEKVLTNNMRAYLPQRIVQFLTATHPTKHTIYLCRHGESEYNTTGRLGGNSPITERGWVFAEILAKFAARHISNLRDVDGLDGAAGWEERAEGDPDGASIAARLWTSSMLRTIQTASLIPHPTLTPPNGAPWESMAPRIYRNIDEIFAGDCEGLTPEEVAATHPQASYLRKMDKIGYRYPRGESYFDLISRLEPCIQEMESYNEPLLIVSHQAILRCIFAYLTGVDREKAPGMETQIQQNVVYQIDLDASSEQHVTGDEKRLPAFVTVHDFRDEVERTMRERRGGGSREEDDKVAGVL